MSLGNGTRVRQYSVLKKIGVGGMGEVYLAEDVYLGRQVALKFLPEHLAAEDEAKTRFTREGQAAAQINHPNVVTIYEVGEHEGLPYIAMEHVAGETLSQCIKKGALSVSEATDITVQMARGLHAAHRLGIVHRDVKPGNIMVLADGTVKILDFGLARLPGISSITRPDAVIGTIGYNSPEQLSGGQVDLRSDVWSLGVVLFKMLTQRLPFRGDDVKAIMYAIAHDTAVDIAEVREDVPDAMRTLCTRCLERDREKRPQHMGEVMEILGEERLSDLPTSIPGTKKPKRWLLAGMAVAALVMVAVAVVLTLIPPDPPPNTDWRVGVVPFEGKSLPPMAAEWPGVVQALFAGNLTGVEEKIGVVDPLSLNTLFESEFGTTNPAPGPKVYRTVQKAGISYLVDGDISRVGSGILVHCKLIDVHSGDMVLASERLVGDEEQLPSSVGFLSQQILEYFHTRMLKAGHNEDLKPWLSYRIRNLEALKAFMQASHYLFHGLAGSENYLRRAIELDPEFVAPRIWLISGLVQSKRAEEAREHYAVLQTLEPKANPFEQAMISWAKAYIDDNPGQQAKALQLALVFSPGNNILLYNLAASQYRQGSFQAAIDALLPAVEMGWRFSEAYYVVGASYAVLGQFKSAEKVLRQSLAIAHVHPYIYGMLSGLAWQSGDTTAALDFEEHFVDALQEQGYSLEGIYAMLGQNHLHMGFNKASIRCYRSVLSMKEEEPRYHDGLALALTRSGDTNTARTEYLTALEHDAQWSNAYRMLGIICEAQGDTNKAVDYYTSYLALDSSSVKALEVRQRLAGLRQ